MDRRKKSDNCLSLINFCRFHMRLHRPGSYLACFIFLTIFLLPMGHGSDQKLSREEARFDIHVAGREIGREKFAVLSYTDSAISSSILDYRDPGKKHQKVHIETQLNMDGRFLPRAYQVRFDIDGQKGSLDGTFTPGQAMFEYKGSGIPQKSGLLVGDRYSVL